MHYDSTADVLLDLLVGCCTAKWHTDTGQLAGCCTVADFLRRSWRYDSTTLPARCQLDYDSDYSLLCYCTIASAVANDCSSSCYYWTSIMLALACWLLQSTRSQLCNVAPTTLLLLTAKWMLCCCTFSATKFHFTVGRLQEVLLLVCLSFLFASVL